MKYFFSFYLVLLSIPIFAQNWLPVGGNLDGHQVQALYVDTSNHILYAGGSFSHAGGIPVGNISCWNGNVWDSLSHGSSNFTNVWSITKFNDTIISSGAFFGSIYNIIAKWDGFYWDSLGSGINSSGRCLYQLNNELLVGGAFSLAGGLPAQRLAKWDGQNWFGYNLPFLLMNSDQICTIEEFNGEIYLGGSFIDTLSWSIYNFGKLCQNQLCEVSTTQPFSGSAAVYKLIEFNHELIVAGEFNSAYGNNLIKWDGQNYLSFGLGTNGPVSDMLIYNNELYIVGNFSMVDGVPVSNIAKWNGTQWTRIGNSVFGNSILCLAIMDDELYVGGGFQDIDGQPISLLAKYSTPLNELENEKEIMIFVNPNPCVDKLNIQYPNGSVQNYSINIKNILGEEIYSQEYQYSNKITQLSTSTWPDGIYFVEFQCELGKIVKQVIKN